VKCIGYVSNNTVVNLKVLKLVLLMMHAKLKCTWRRRNKAMLGKFIIGIHQHGHFSR
jgi:hypothetical protein